MQYSFFKSDSIPKDLKLEDLGIADRELLAKKFIEEVILPQWKQLSSWNRLTHQTSQLDFGYLSQHLVSLISGIPGKNQRGKGDDLSDGSEVKAASCVDAEDTPRWNNVNCRKVSQETLKKTMLSMPYLFFVMLDTTERGGDILRCRIWCVRPGDDDHFMAVMMDWARKYENGEIKSNNLQLHPPRWEKAAENLTTNSSGNLKLPLVYECVQLNVPGILVMNTTMLDLDAMENGLSEPVGR